MAPDGHPPSLIGSVLPIDVPARPRVPGQGTIDPMSIGMVNRDPIANYRLPGAVVDHDLAIPLTKTGKQRPRKKRSPPGKQQGMPGANAENEIPRPQTSEEGVAAGGEVVSGRRKRKVRLNPDGEEFERPKKKGRGCVA
jgi:hypothetical protein